MVTTRPKPLLCGATIELEGEPYEVVSVSPILTPFRKAGQDTKVEGYSYGLRKERRLERQKTD